jgi:hypothetical protein
LHTFGPDRTISGSRLPSTSLAVSHEATAGCKRCTLFSVKGCMRWTHAHTSHGAPSFLYLGFWAELSVGRQYDDKRRLHFLPFCSVNLDGLNIFLAIYPSCSSQSTPSNRPIAIDCNGYSERLAILQALAWRIAKSNIYTISIFLFTNHRSFNPTLKHFLR